jgi:hypothetical protein
VVLTMHELTLLERVQGSHALTRHRLYYPSFVSHVFGDPRDSFYLKVKHKDLLNQYLSTHNGQVCEYSPDMIRIRFDSESDLTHFVLTWSS